MIQPMCQLSIMLKEVFGQTRNAINAHPHTPLEAVWMGTTWEPRDGFACVRCYFLHGENRSSHWRIMTRNDYFLLQERLKNWLDPSQCLLFQGILRLTWPVIRLWSDYNWFTTFNQPNIIFVFCPQFWRYFCQDRMNVYGRNRSVLMFLHCILDNSSHSSLYVNLKITVCHKSPYIFTVVHPVSLVSPICVFHAFSHKKA